MKKHIFGIFTYFATFFLSFLLVASLTEKPQVKATSCFPHRSFTNSRDVKLKTGQETEIRNLLTLDRDFGFSYFAGDQTADDTDKLVENMQSLLDNENLPIPFVKAYAAHTEAWNNYAKHLGKSKNHRDSDAECKILNRRINETYDTLLLTAQSFDVDFSN